MAHRLWHGIDVDVYIERIGIAVLGARLWATQLMSITENLEGLLRPTNTSTVLTRTAKSMLLFRWLDDGFASENLSLGGSA